MQERDLGRHKLKDIDQPERIYQLEVDGLPSDFPPLRTHGEEPLDFEARLKGRIQSYVESRVELALANPGATQQELPAGMTKLAAGGLFIAFLSLCLLAVLVIGTVLLVRWLF